MLSRALGETGLVTCDSFAAPMKHFIAAALSEKYQLMDKERPRPELNGFSVRQSLIMLGEDCCGTVYGPDVFGRWLAHRALKYPNRQPDFVVVDDGAFTPEIDALPNRFVVQVYRRGKAFDGGGYSDWYQYRIYNDDDLANLWTKANDAVNAILKWSGI
jgi:hypothetical protein